MRQGMWVRSDDEVLAGTLAEIRPFLNERQWRSLLGAEERALGWGGIKRVARAAGVSPDTVGRGAGELESGVAPEGRGPRGGMRAGLGWRTLTRRWWQHWTGWWIPRLAVTRSRRPMMRLNTLLMTERTKPMPAIRAAGLRQRERHCRP
jgi:hypothetical protein